MKRISKLGNILVVLSVLFLIIINVHIFNTNYHKPDIKVQQKEIITLKQIAPIERYNIEEHIVKEIIIPEQYTSEEILTPTVKEVNKTSELITEASPIIEEEELNQPDISVDEEPVYDLNKERYYVNKDILNLKNEPDFMMYKSTVVIYGTELDVIDIVKTDSGTFYKVLYEGEEWFAHKYDLTTNKPSEEEIETRLSRYYIKCTVDDFIIIDTIADKMTVDYVYELLEEVPEFIMNDYKNDAGKIILKRGLKEKDYPNAVGLYNPNFYSIKLDIQFINTTIYHELGHYFEDKYKAMTKVKITDDTRDFFNKENFYSEKDDELFAESFSYYILNNEEFKVQCPDTYQDLDLLIKELKDQNIIE